MLSDVQWSELEPLVEACRPKANPVRLHSALGYRSPIRYEQDMLANP